jgi:cytochrome c oxidase cbb3-type subunit 3
MPESDQERILDHDYDGIREYDNPLPGWWTWLFIISVAFSCLYILYYHIGVGSSIEEKYEDEVAAHYEKLLESLGEIRPDTATILQLSRNEEWMPAVGSMFAGNCAQCHGADGGGIVGPNLTDDHYKNIREPADFYTVIANGIAGTSMPAWGDRMSEPQMILLAAYAASLRGTTPAAPKAPEGNIIDPWPAAPAEDATSPPAADADGGS